MIIISRKKVFRGKVGGKERFPGCKKLSRCSERIFEFAERFIGEYASEAVKFMLVLKIKRK